MLAGRFPYSREVAGTKEIQNDSRLQDKEGNDNHLTDFVIAEVKSGRKGGLNNVWKAPPNVKKVQRIAYPPIGP